MFKCLEIIISKGDDWWWEYEEGIRHYSKEALNQVGVDAIM